MHPEEFHGFQIPGTCLGCYLAPLTKIFIIIDGSFIPAKFCYALNKLYVRHQMSYVFMMLLTIDFHEDMKSFCLLREGFNFCCVICFNKHQLAILFHCFEFWFLIPDGFGNYQRDKFDKIIIKHFCINFKVHPWADWFRNAGFNLSGEGVGSSTGNVPDDIISIKVDDSGAWTIGIAAAMQVSTN